MTANQNKSIQTSIEALWKMVKTKTADQQKIFDELIKHKDKGLTSNEIEMLVKNRRANSRVAELVKAGWVKTTSKKRRNSGRRGPGTGGTAFIHIVPAHVRNGGLPVPPKPKSTPATATKVSIAQSINGFSVYINGQRIAGAKPVHGEFIETWQVRAKDIAKAISK